MNDQAQELSPDECRELLGTDAVGRVAFMTPVGPRIVPVNYLVRGRTVEFRTTAYSEVATYAPGTEIAFEVDHLDRERKRGWSVVAHGQCVREMASELATRDPEDAPEPWAGGHRSLLLTLTWRELTGRRVGDRWPHPVISRPAAGP